MSSSSPEFIRNLLEEVSDIVEKRSDAYGDFREAMIQTAEVCSVILGKEITMQDACFIYAINKLVREGGDHNPDNVKDAIAYLAITLKKD